MTAIATRAVRSGPAFHGGDGVHDRAGGIGACCGGVGSTGGRGTLSFSAVEERRGARGRRDAVVHGQGGARGMISTWARRIYMHVARWLCISLVVEYDTRNSRGITLLCESDARRRLPLPDKYGPHDGWGGTTMENFQARAEIFLVFETGRMVQQ